MDNSTVNFTTPVPSNSTSHSIGSMTLSDPLKMLLCIINVVFGVPIHSYVMWLIVNDKKSSVALKVFHLNLSVCELGNCLNAMLNILSTLSLSLTTVTNFLQGLGITGRPLFQCLICVECYLAVVHPVIFLKYKPLRYRVICSVAAWIIMTCSCLSCIFLLVSNDSFIFTVFFSVQFLFFFFIQLFCLTAVLGALKHSGPGERAREKEEENHMKRRAFYLILLTTINMFILYVPFIAFGLSIIFTKVEAVELWVGPVLCYVVAGFIQPVLFLHSAGKLSCLCPS